MRVRGRVLVFDTNAILNQNDRGVLADDGFE